MAPMRTERDSMGEVQVPADRLYGAQTARAADNFPISGWAMPREFIAALAMIKQAAAEVNKQTGQLDGRLADAIIAAAGEVVEGRWDDHFPVDVFQTGSGTSSNMNANEVIANRAIQLLGGILGDKAAVHPNDHVNKGQSSNDVIPTALHVSTALAIQTRLRPALGRLRDCLADKEAQFDAVVKIGRTHLMDAVPIRLGQEFSGYRAQVSEALSLLDLAVEKLCPLALGGTAVGTGLNAPAGMAQAICDRLARRTGLPLRTADNYFAAMSAKDACVFASGAIKTAAVALSKIASDIRLLGSGPRCGLGEIILPDLQPGSSIMPGKVNPVICETVVQVACQVIGCDAAVTAGAMGGVGSILQLNVAMPMIACNLHTAIKLLANAADVLEAKCIRGLTANERRCRELIELSMAMVTALAPKIGYDTAASIAKEAYHSGKTVRQLCLEKALLPPAELEALLDARSQTGK